MKNDIDKLKKFIEFLNDKNMQRIIAAQENIIALLSELSEYRDLATLDELEEMLEMKKQKKVVEIIPVVGISGKYECPNCGSSLTDADVFAGHCKWCGQAVKL